MWKMDFWHMSYCFMRYLTFWQVFRPKASPLKCPLLTRLIFVTAGNLLISSFRSNQMSDFKRFAQITQDKWANVSESLRSLKTNERFAQVAHDKWATLSDSLRSLKTNERTWANRSGRSRQMSDSLLRLLMINDQMSDLLRSLRGKERSGANRSGRSPKMSESLIFWSESLICSFLGKKPANRSENQWVNSQP